MESLLYTDFYNWRHSPTGSENIAAEEYHIPSDIQAHIDYITPGIRLRPHPGRVRALKRKAEAEKLRSRMVHAMNTGMEIISPDADTLPPLNSSVCDTLVTQECIRTQYSIPKGDKAAPGNELGIFESLSDHYAKEDLDVFWSTLYPEIPNGTYPREDSIDGAFGASKTLEEAGIESDLDFEAAQPLIWPQKTVLYQTDDEFYEVNETSLNTPLKGFWNTFYDALDGSYCTYSAFGETGNCVLPECLDPAYPDPNPGGYKGELQCGVYTPTNVISISYGGGESDVPDFYTKRQCNEIMKLGLQGVTVVISSGDDGVGSFEGDPTPSGCAGPNENIFYPASDATCPYVLAVGSTQFVKVSNTSTTPTYFEQSTSRFPSGGGFSNFFDTPDYQKDQVAAYFDEVTLNFTGYTDAGTNFSNVGDGVCKCLPLLNALVGTHNTTRDTEQLTECFCRQNRRPWLPRRLRHRRLLYCPRTRVMGPCWRHVIVGACVGSHPHPRERRETGRWKGHFGLCKPNAGESPYVSPFASKHGDDD